MTKETINFFEEEMHTLFCGVYSLSNTAYAGGCVIGHLNSGAHKHLAARFTLAPSENNGIGFDTLNVKITSPTVGEIDNFNIPLEALSGINGLEIWCGSGGPEWHGYGDEYGRTITDADKKNITAKIQQLIFPYLI